jgi:hypothetical protein
MYMRKNKGKHMHTYRIYETEFPGQQTQPVGFWGNDFGGNINRPVLTDYRVVGYNNSGHHLVLRSKTGDSTDSITIGFIVDTNNFDSFWMGKTASFSANLDWDYTAQRWYYSWTCTGIK